MVCSTGLTLQGMDVATGVAGDDGIAHGVRATQDITVLAVDHVAVADHEVTGFGQHVVEHDTGRRIAVARAVRRGLMLTMAAVGGGPRRVEGDVHCGVDLVIVEIGVVALTATAQLERALMGVVFEARLETDTRRELLAHDQPAAQGAEARKTVVAREVVGKLFPVEGDIAANPRIVTDGPGGRLP